MTSITPTSHEHWLQLRAEDVTSTEVSALFGLSPYTTEFELHHRKLTKDINQIEQTERMKWGLRFEKAIAEGIAEDYGWEVKPLKDYHRHNTQRRMGASFDYEIISHERGPGILEIKNVDQWQFSRTWIRDKDDPEAPEHIELQLQQQLEIIGYEWGVIAAMVGGNQPVVLIRDKDKEIGKKLCERIERFWKDIDAKIEPKIDFERDYSIVKELYKDASGDPVDLTGNNRANVLCGIYRQAGEDEGAAKKLRESAKAELLTLIENAPQAIIGDYKISAKNVERKGYTVEPSSYRDFRVSGGK